MICALGLLTISELRPH